MTDKKSKKYNVKPPKDCKEFKVYWKRFIGNIKMRDNFSETHLKNLEVLCALYVDYDRMTSYIDQFYEREHCYSIHTVGRYGEQVKTIPELTERKTVLAEIRQYSRMLGIILNKDNNRNENDDADDWK